LIFVTIRRILYEARKLGEEAPMNPMLASNRDWTVPEGLEWLAAWSGFLGAGCAVLCLVGVLLLLREAWNAMESGMGSLTTWQAEFMGYGVAKERLQARTRKNAQPQPGRAATAPVSLESKLPSHA
jgi:hypothetical protein